MILSFIIIIIIIFKLKVNLYLLNNLNVSKAFKLSNSLIHSNLNLLIHKEIL